MMTLRPRWASCVFVALAVLGSIVPPARAGSTYPDLLIGDYPFTIDRFNLGFAAPDPGPSRQPGDPPATFVSSNYLNSTLSPSGLAFGPDGNLYVAIYGIRRGGLAVHVRGGRGRSV